MLTDDWEQIKQIFDTALHLPDAERRSYVENACADQPQRIAIITELLSNHFGAGRFLETVTVKIHPVFSQDEIVAGRFRIIRLIGDGGMGEVYEAFDERLRVRVALKTLHAELTSDLDALERFRREILIAREVSHESVCKIFDLVEHTDAGTRSVIPCLTMQLVQGESLLKFLQTRRPLAPADALPLIRQIASAIDTLHVHDIIHRDLKPSNIMLTSRNGTPLAVVTDFGLAKPISHNEVTFFESRVDFQAGAPYFMAPELLRDGRPSAASDIYSLGLIIDEMVTATRAFPSESLHGLYYQKLWETPIPPTSRASSLDAKWDHVILRCLALEPELRYRHAKDALADLEGRPSTPPTLPVVTPSLADAPTQPIRKSFFRRWKFRFRLRHSLIALGVIVLIVGALLPFASFIEPSNNSVVVFPFENQTNRPDLDYVCTGIRTEVMRRLTPIEGLQVIPYYESRAKTQLVQLKGRFSLEGLVYAAGNRIRLTAQLTDNHDGSLVWSQVFESDVQNPLDLESAIAEGSVATLREQALLGRSLALSGLSPGIINRIARLLSRHNWDLPPAATRNAAAFSYYSRGLMLFEERTVPGALEAIQSYQSALREDPNFALADAGLADVQFVLSDFEYEPVETLVARARHYAAEAIRLDPSLAEPYSAMASVQQSNWDYKAAEESFKKAIQLNPKFARGHRWYAGLLMQFARFDECFSQLRQSIELDPYDAPAQSNRGLFLNFAHRYREAIAQFEETLKHKDLIVTHRDLGDAYFELALESPGPQATDYFSKALQQADLVEAAMRRSMARYPPLNGALTVKHADRMHAEYYTLSGRPAKARPYLARILADTNAGRISPVTLASVYATTGKEDEAISLLQKAAMHKDRQLLFLRVSPQYDRLRENPKFQALIHQIGLL